MNMFDCYPKHECFWHSHDGRCYLHDNWKRTTEIIPPATTTKATTTTTTTTTTTSTTPAPVNPDPVYSEPVSPGLVGESPDQAEISHIVNNLLPELFPELQGISYTAPTEYYDGGTEQAGSQANDTTHHHYNGGFEPMNPCETLTERIKCGRLKDCIWDYQNTMCLDRHSYCPKFKSWGMCNRGKHCVWDKTKNTCLHPCFKPKTSADCALAADEECFWTPATKSCRPHNTPCHQLTNPDLCMQNKDGCFWNDRFNKCKSFYNKCSTMDSYDQCSQNRACLFHFNTQECREIAGGFDYSAPQTCSDILDRDVCTSPNATNHLKCMWDEQGYKCVDYKFDCESFYTAKECKANGCWWDMHSGECDQRFLMWPHNGIAQPMKQALLRSTRIHSSDKVAHRLFSAGIFICVSLILLAIMYTLYIKRKDIQRENADDGFNYRLNNDYLESLPPTI